MSQYAERGMKVTLNAVLLKAIAIAQTAHPASRRLALPWGKTAEIDDVVAGFTVDRFVGANPAVFLGMVEAADSKPLEEIANEMEAYAQEETEDLPHLDLQSRFSKLPRAIRRAALWLSMRDPELRLRYLNATFALSNIGKFGCQLIIPPSLSTSTFGVGAIEQRVVVKEGVVQVRPTFTLALNFDHYVIDGAPAARFLKDVCDLLQGGLGRYLPAELTNIELTAPPPVIKTMA